MRLLRFLAVRDALLPTLKWNHPHPLRTYMRVGLFHQSRFKAMVEVSYLKKLEVVHHFVVLRLSLIV